MSVDSIVPYLEPVRKSVTVPGAPAAVYELFTSRFGEWWPLTLPYSVFGDAASECGMEPGVGGEIFELSRDGRRCVWGTVVAWEPPRRVEFSWHPGRDAERTRTGYDTGWDVVLRRWADFALT